MQRILAAALIVVVLLSVGVGSYVYVDHGPTQVSTTAGSNLQVDRFPANTSYSWAQSGASIQGVEPYVAVGSNGDIYVTWIGISASIPTEYLNSSTQFRSQILFAESTDGANSFTSPVVVSNASNPLTNDCFDPSIAVAPGTSALYVSFVCYQSSGPNLSVALAVGTPSSKGGQYTFTQSVVAQGPDFDRPWVSVTGNGTVYLVWDDYYGLYWASRAANQTGFTGPYSEGFPSLGGWVSGLGVSGNGTLFLTAYGVGPVVGLTAPEYNFSVMFGRLEQTHGTSVFRLQTLQTSSAPYPTDYEAKMMFHPQPTLAVLGNGSAFIAYVSDDGHSLSMIHSISGHSGWSSPVALLTSNSSLVQMPWLALSPDGTELAVGWMANATGYWNAYASVYSLATSKFTTPVMVSSANGYQSGVLNWHGDFLGAAFVSQNRFIVVWSDGRGLSNYYGYGHIYASLVSL